MAKAVLCSGMLSRDGRGRTLRTSSGKCALSPCEDILATAVGENRETIEVLQVASRTSITTLTKHKQFVTALAFSPTGEHFVSGDTEGNLSVWSVASWRELQELIGHTRGITTAAFHPNGSQVITASHDHTARVWDFESGEQLASLPLAEESDLSLYEGDQRQIRRILNRLSQGYSHKSTLHSITFSPAGDLIAGGLHREIRLWDATTYETRMAIIPPDTCQRPNIVIFSPCARYLVSGFLVARGARKSIYPFMGGFNRREYCDLLDPSDRYSGARFFTRRHAFSEWRF